MSEKRSLLAAIKHSDLKNGECIVKLEGDYFVCSMTSFVYEKLVEGLTVVRVEGYVKE